MKPWLLSLIVIACAACSSRNAQSGANLGCPPPDPGAGGDSTAGTACPSDEEGHVCFVDDEFSSCLSAFYRCSGGTWMYDHGLGNSVGRLDGFACTGDPIDYCAYEGNPTCTAEPTSQSCQCGADGTWVCFCSCYGSNSDCGTCPETFPGVGSNQFFCDAGTVCDYTGHSCTCSNGYFSCM